jgi:metacaspase-1
MKRLLTFGCIFLLFLSISFNSFGSESGKKLALIIAVAKYPAEGGWSQISSDKDIQLIEATLLKQGFDKDNITVIIDEKAKKEGILNALEDIKKKAGKDDVIVIHYSGHGQQIRDDNDDEIDGYDEALIPFDAHLRFKKDVYTGENHLRDEEFGAILDDIRTKVGSKGNVLVILDACHSGTGTRGFGKSRGTAEKFAPESYNPPQKQGEEKGGMFESKGKSRGESDDTDLGSIVVISGAKQNELNYEYQDEEGNYYGSLSYAVSKILSNADKNLTYRGLFDKIELEMSVIAPKQTPQIEGDLDRGILGGNAVEQIPYFKVKEWIDDKTVVLQAGELMGLNDSSVVEFYDMNTTDPSKSETEAFCTGTILNSTAVECDVVLSKALSSDEALNSRVFMVSQNFGKSKVGVKINIKKNPGLVDLLTNKLNSLNTVKIVDHNPELIVDNATTRSASQYELLTSDEFILYSEADLKSNEVFVNNVIDEIKSYAQVSIIRNLEMTDRNLEVSFEIIPITVKKVGSRFVEDQRLDLTSFEDGGELNFKDGDVFKVKITNNGYTPAYFQILDIRADNEIALLVPSGNRKADEYRVRPKDSMELGELFVFGEPYGKEVFKLIATEQAINLEGIVTTRGVDVGKKGSKSPFESLFSDSYVKMRAVTLSAPPSSAHIYSKMCRVNSK